MAIYTSEDIICAMAYYKNKFGGMLRKRWKK
jgi:hypothetical protein